MGFNRNKIKNHKPIVIESLEQLENVELEELHENVDDLKIEENDEIEEDMEDIVEEDEEDIVENVVEEEVIIDTIEEDEEKVVDLIEINGIKVTVDKQEYLDEKDNRKPITEDAVICINTKKIYDDNKMASEDTGANASSIKKCCNGNAKSAGKDENGDKLVWEFLINYLKTND